MRGALGVLTVISVGASPAAAGNYGTLEILVKPPDSALYFNGALYTNAIGDKPFRLTLSPGAVSTIKISKGGAQPFEERYQVAAGESMRVEVRLLPTRPPLVKHTIVAPAKSKNGNATVDVIANVHGARVSIQGREVGASPVIGWRLKAGQSYAIHVRAPGRVPWHRLVPVRTGRNPAVIANLSEPAKGPAARAAKPAAAPKALKVPPSLKGDAKRGKALLVRRCGSCHEGPKRIKGKMRTQRQWVRYWASGRHVYRAPLSGKVTLQQLAHIRDYLKSRAADVTGDRAAGVR